jgi:WD40 repeat protein
MELDGYAVEGEVGRGGMGCVLRARDRDGRLVAMKLLIRPGARQVVDRFAREARLGGALGEAEGFVPLLAAGVSSRGPYLVMPFLAGGTLRQRLAPGPLPVAEGVTLGQALAGAIGRAHARGIVHRDLKPENILFAEDGRPFIADLGLAKHFDAAAPGASQSVALSRTGELRGTLGYAAPEQLRDASTVGPPADVFALGVLLYEALAGEHPFRGESVPETIGRTLAGRARPLRRVRPDVPGHVALAIDRAIAVSPAERWPDGAGFAAALEGAAGGGPRRRPAGLAVVAGMIVVGAAGLAWLSYGRTAPRSGHGDAAEPTTPPLGAPAAASPSAAAPRPPAPYPSETRTLRRIEAHGTGRWNLLAGAHSARATPDGERLLVAESQGWIELVDLRTGLAAWCARSPGPDAAALAVSPDGRVGAAASEQSLRLFDVADGAPRAELALGTSARGLAFSPDGAALAVAAADGLVVVDVAPARVRARSAGPGLRAVAWLPDGSALVAGGEAGELRLFTTKATALGEPSTQGPKAIECLALVGDRRVVSGTVDGTLAWWDLVHGPGSAPRLAFVRAVDAHRGEVRALAATPDGRRVVSGGGDDAVHVWSPDDGRLVASLEGVHRMATGVAIAADGSAVWSTDYAERLRGWRVADGRRLDAEEGHTSGVSGLALLPSGGLLSAAHDETVRLWPPDDGTKEVRRLAVPGGVFGFALTPDGRHVVAGSSEAESLVLDLADGSARPFPVRWALAAAVSRDGRSFATGALNGHVRLWSLDDGQEVAFWAGHPREVTGLVYGEGRVYTTGLDGTLRDWDLGGGFGNRTLLSGPPLHALAAAPDVHLVLCGGDDGRVTVCDADAPQVLRTIACGGPVRALAVTPDGRLAASASDDGVVRLFEPASGEERDRLDLGPCRDVPWALSLTPDGRGLLVGTARGVVLRYTSR